MITPNNKILNSRLFTLYLPCFALLLYLVPAVWSVQYDDITTDEWDDLNYGIQVLKLNTSRYTDNESDFRSTMPVTAINAIPRAVEQILHPGLQKNDWGETDIRNGRYMTILVTLGLLFYCFLFGKALAGAGGGAVVMLLVATDPNILAHSRLVTKDIYGTLGFIATLYHLYQWLVNKKKNHFLYCCIAITVANCCKVNNVILYPLCFITIAAYKLSGWDKKLLKSWGIKFLIFVLVQLFIINLFFLFHKTGMSLSAYNFKSSFFASLQQSWLADIPLPLPKSFVDGFDLIRYETETFDGAPMNYLLGELRYKQGFWNYYLVCWWYKTPVFTLMLSMAAMVFLLIKRESRKATLLFWTLPAIVSFLFLSSSPIQNGYRYLLPFLVLSLIFSGVLVFKIFSRRYKPVLAGLFAVPVIVVFLSFPNYISYTNILIRDKTKAWEYFADSNLNWGQRHKKIKSFLQQHPDYIFEPEKPVTGTIVVDLNKLAGIFNPGEFRWLRENYKPVAVFDECYLIYEVNKLPE
jgi:hypothetical protein